MTEGIKDKIVVISGASNAFGEAAARHLAREEPSSSWARSRDRTAK